MRYGEVEQIILKGANAYSDGYITNTTLEALSGYQEFEGLFISKQPQLISDSDIEVYPSGYRSSVGDYSMLINIESLWQDYPTSSFDIRDYMVDNSGNSLKDVLKCKYHWIQNTGTHKYELIPTGEADYTTKNLSVGIKPQYEQTSSKIRVLLEAYTGLI